MGSLDCFAEPVIGPATSGRTSWLPMTPRNDESRKARTLRLPRHAPAAGGSASARAIDV